MRLQLRIALALWLVASAPICPAGAATTEPAIPAGQDELIADILGVSAALPAGCRFTAGRAEPSAIHATYQCAAREVVIELRPPDAAGEPIARTARFAIFASEGAPALLVSALVERVGARGAAFRWNADEPASVWTGHGYSGPPRQKTLWKILLVVIVVIGYAILSILRRGISRPDRPAPWSDVRSLAAVGCAAALVAVALVGVHSEPARGYAPLVAYGIVGAGILAWLCALGVSRADWVAAVPVAVALVVRGFFTLHSLDEIEVQFAQGPFVKHSIVYAVVQLFFAPLVVDPHEFTMGANGVFGSLACLPLYLFVRQRTASRSAGVLCALFLATHPLVARYAPTDGTFSLLLFAWFSGLAVLSRPAISAGAIAGGAAFIGVAATMRMEGGLLFPASVLLLDQRALLGALRRHPFIATSSLLGVVSLVVAHLHFLLSMHAPGDALAAMDEELLASVVSRVALYIEPLGWPPLRQWDDFLWPMRANGPLYPWLVAAGAISGVVTRRWLGVGAALALLLLVAPVVHSTHVTAVHRLVPAAALQAILAGLGAHALLAWIPAGNRWRWMLALPGCLFALSVLSEQRERLTRPYVFTEQYALVRRHLGPAADVDRRCTLLAFPPDSDLDIHKFDPVVPHLRVVDCRTADCVGEVARGGCVYYVRSATCYYHPAGVPPACSSDARAGQPGLRECLSPPSRAFEDAVALDAVERRTIDIGGTFAEVGNRYPRRAEVGLFRARPK